MISFSTSEPNDFKRNFNVTVEGHHLAADFMALRKLLDSYPTYKLSWISGPDVNNPNLKEGYSYLDK
jgi:hypothetical protein